MRIHSLSFDNLRGVEHFQLSNIPDTGVVIVSGSNEAGKSTILDALDMVLTQKHTTGKAQYKLMRPVGRDVPTTITLDATIGPHHINVTKTYFKQKRCELRILTPTVENLTGGEAEQRLEDILAEHIDPTLLSALFVRQGTIDERINAAGIPSLSAALSAAGTANDLDNGNPTEVTGDNTALMDAVAKEYGRYFSEKTAKPTGEYKQAEADLAAAEQRYAQAQSDVDSVKNYVDRVSEAEAIRDDAAQRIPGVREELEQVRADLAEAQEATKHAHAATEKKNSAQIVLEAAEQRLEQRTALKTRVAALSKHVETLLEQQPELEQAHQEEQQRAAELHERVTQAQQLRDTAAAAVRDAKQQLTRASQLRDWAHHTQLLDQVAGINDQIVELENMLPSNPISAELVQKITEAERDTREARIRASAVAAKITTQAVGEGAPTEILLDGEPTPVGETHTLTHATTVRIADVDIHITPGLGNEDVFADLTRCEQQLTALLDDVAASSAEEALSRAQAERQLAEEITNLTRERTAIIGTRDVDDMRRHTQRIEQLLGDFDPITVDEAEQALVKASAAHEEAEEHHTQADSDARVHESRVMALRTPAETALNIHRSNLEAAQATLAEAADELATAELEHTQEQLDAAHAQALSNFEQATAAEQHALDALAQADPELRRSLYEGAQAQLDSLRERIDDARTTIATCTGYIEQAQGAAERLENSHAEVDNARRHHASIQRRAEAAKRLRDVLIGHRDAARAAYAKPFADKLNDLARAIFGPDQRFDLDAELGIDSRVNIGSDGSALTSVPVGQLSGGAQEQLGMLQRFAVSELAGCNLPVIIDDALGHTDTHRLSRMATVLSRAGRQQQIIVLTSTPARFEKVVGKKEYSVTDLQM